MKIIKQLNMKTNKLKFYAAFFLLIAIKSNATHLAGGEIKVVKTGNYKYDIYIVYYRDCSGVPAGSPSCTAYNYKNRNLLFNFTPTEISVKEITNTCITASKRCNPQNTYGTGQGIERHTYQYTYDFSTIYSNGVCEIEIAFQQCCRSNINTGGSATQFYINTMFNICLGNSSPEIIDEDKNFLNCNQPTYFSFNAIDSKDNDSLVYELTDALTFYNSKISYNSGFSAKNPLSVYYPTNFNKSAGSDHFAQNPIGIYFNSRNGDMIFTPTGCSEIAPMVVRIYEYRKDSKTGKYNLVGFVTHENNLRIVNSALNYQPIINSPPNLVVYDNKKTCFEISTSDQPYKVTGGATYYNDTTYLSMLKTNLNATFTINDSKAKLKSAKVCIEPQNLVRNEPYSLTFKVIDNACDLYGYNFKSVNLFVKDSSKLVQITGTTYFDINQNCQKDDDEPAIPFQRIKMINNNFFTLSDSNGKYKFYFSPVNDTLMIFNTFKNVLICKKAIDIKNDTNYNYDLGIKCNLKINGYVYDDDSLKNCTKESFDKSIQDFKIYTNPSSYSCLSNSSGYYSLFIPFSNYKLIYEGSNSNQYVNCFNHKNMLLRNDTMYYTNDFAVSDSSKIEDLSVYLNVKYGFVNNSNNKITLLVKNKGIKTQNGKVTLNFDKRLKYVNSSTYDSKTDSTITWTFSNLIKRQNVKYEIEFSATSTFCKSGDTMNFSALIDKTYIPKDLNFADNFDNKKIIIMNSFGNEVKDEFITSGYTYPEFNKLKYIIGFRNTGKSIVKNISVTDTLNLPLDTNKLKIVESSHKFSYKLINNVLTVNFKDINLPDSLADYSKSFAYFIYEISIDSQTMSEKKFYNTAQINYDNLPSINTNAIYNTFISYIKTGNTNKSEYCSGDTLKVPYTSIFKFNNGNKFKLILDDYDSTNLKNTFVLDSVSSILENGKDAFVFKIPKGLITNKGILRVESSNPYSKILDDAKSNAIKIYQTPAKPVITKVDNTLKSSYSSGNQWYNDTTIITGATSQDFTPVKTGNYYVKHKSDKGCISPLSDKFYIFLSINKFKNNGIKIYPNPSKGKIFIETQNASAYHVELYDLQGKLLELADFNGNKFEWNLNLTKGIYLIKIVNNNNELSMQLIEVL